MSHNFTLETSNGDRLPATPENIKQQLEFLSTDIIPQEKQFFSVGIDGSMKSHSMSKRSPAFLILEVKPNFYLQTRWNYNRSGWQTEYRAGTQDQHFITYPATQHKVLDLFTSYLHSPETIDQEAHWIPFNITNDPEIIKQKFAAFRSTIVDVISTHWQRVGQKLTWFLEADDMTYSLVLTKWPRHPKYLAHFYVAPTHSINVKKTNLDQGKYLYIVDFIQDFLDQFQSAYGYQYLINSSNFFNSALGSDRRTAELRNALPEMLDFDIRRHDLNLLFDRITKIFQTLNTPEKLEHYLNEVQSNSSLISGWEEILKKMFESSETSSQ